MQYQRLCCLLLFSISAILCTAQSVAINTDGSAAASSAMLDIKSTIKGLLLPRMSRTERNAIAAPATGLLIYQNAPDSTGFYYYNGSNWVALAGSAAAVTQAWSTNGNTGTNAASDFLGTADNQDIVFKRNNTRSGYIGSRNTSWGTGALNPAATGTGNVALGTNALAAVTTGNYNTATGDSALYSSGGGAYNTVIGAKAGYNITTGSNNVLIGYQAGYNITTASDKLYIANNSSDPPLVYGDFSNKAIALGNSHEVQAPYSIALGYLDTVTISGFGAVVAGHANKAAAQFAFLAGERNITGSSCNSCIAGGVGNYLNAYNGIAFGQSNTVLGSFSFSAGINNYIGSPQGYVIGNGDSTFASGTFAIGVANKVRGVNAIAIGTANESPSFGETTMGIFATQYTPANVANSAPTDRLFTIGNGDFFVGRSDALVLLKNGNLGLGSSTPGSRLVVKGDFALGTNGTAINEIIKQTVTGNIPAISALSTTNVTLTVPNVAAGSSVLVSPATVLSTGTVIGYALVSAANTVTLYVGNCSNTLVSAQGGVSFYVTVIR